MSQLEKNKGVQADPPHGSIGAVASGASAGMTVGAAIGLAGGLPGLLAGAALGTIAGAVATEAMMETITTDTPLHPQNKKH
jgi:outer membrane lipoprotein SlyB